MADCTQCVLRDTCWLNQLAIGGQGRVMWVSGETNVCRRLLEMGFCSGTCVTMLRRAPLGDPIEFRLRGYCVSLRDEQARHIRVTTA